MSDKDQYKGRIRFRVFKQEQLEFKNLPGTSELFRDNNIYKHGEKLRDSWKNGQSISAEYPDVILASMSDAELNAKKAQEEKRLNDAISDVNNKELEALQKGLVKGLRIREAEPRRWVDLYFPISLQIDDNVTYDNQAALNVVGGAVIKGLQNDEGLLGSMAKGVTDATLSLFDAFRASGMATDASRLAAVRLTQKWKSVNNALSYANQVAINPNIRTLFRGVPVRQFAFNFQMIPTSPREAREIADIIQLFREELYPEAIVEKDDMSIGYKFPNMFDISFKWDGGPARIPGLEKCYLTGLTHNYNPTQASFFRDGNPSEIQLSLRFMEIRALNKKDIEHQGHISRGTDLSYPNQTWKDPDKTSPLPGPSNDTTAPVEDHTGGSMTIEV